MSTFLKPGTGGTYIAIKVQPRASKNEIGPALGDELKIKVTAPPVDAAANEAVIELLADTLGCARSKVQITKGQTSRHKTIFVSGMSVAEISKKLEL
ncbi:MAG: hypothetical protein JWO95_3517 [Verrucomicrobiales bacterium]|nr:hypothetical protein [Verrucomicrobiales bacterium]